MANSPNIWNNLFQKLILGTITFYVKAIYITKSIFLAVIHSLTVSVV
jgi:hypothetical protein